MQRKMCKFKRVKSRFLTIFVYFKRKIVIFNDFCIFREVLLEIAISRKNNAISREKIGFHAKNRLKNVWKTENNR